MIDIDGGVKGNLYICRCHLLLLIFYIPYYLTYCFQLVLNFLLLLLETSWIMYIFYIIILVTWNYKRTILHFI